jgi:hypothetical protein
MQLMDKTGGYCDEFKVTDVFNSTRVKTIVNPNRQGGREVYGKETNFKNTANIILATNHDIGATDTDYGYWRRNLYYEAKVKFCENPDPNNTFEKKVNDNVMDVYTNDPVYQEAWLSILVHYHTRLQTDYGGNIKRVPRPTIDRETELYRDRQDTLNRFINQMIVRSPGAEPIVLDRVATAYTDWYNRYVQPTRFKIDNVVSLFEASKLHESITNLPSGAKILGGHRVLDSLEDQIQEGESYLNQSALNNMTPGGEEDVNVECGDGNNNDCDDNVGDINDEVIYDSSTDDDTDSAVDDQIEEYSDDDTMDYIALAERNTPIKIQNNKEIRAQQRKTAIEAAEKRKQLREHMIRGGITKEQLLAAGV